MIEKQPKNTEQKTAIRKKRRARIFTALLSVLCFFDSQNIDAQISASQVLASAKKDAIFQLKNEQTDILRSNPLKMPNWDKVEFRMNTNEFDLLQNEYAIRISKNPKGMIDGQKQVYGSLLQIADIESVIQFSNALESRYEAILQSKFSEELQAKRKELVLILEDKKRVIENRLAFGLDNDLEKFADIEANLQEEALNAFDFDFYKKQLSRRFAAWTDSSDKIFVDFQNFISLQKLKSIVTEIQSKSILNHPEVRRRQLQNELAIKEENLEKREDQQLLNFLQVRYKGDEDPYDYFRERLSVGMGLRLGTKHTRGLRSQELQVETLETRKEIEITKEELIKDFREETEELDYLFLKLDLLKKQLADYRLKFATEVLLERGIAKPIFLLKAKETIIKKEIVITKTEYELYKKYLDLLFLSGKPVELPMRNFLAENLEEF